MITRLRSQTWLIVVAVLALVLTYLVIWTTYAAVHVYPRYVQLAPGEASEGTTHYRVLKLITTEVADASEGDASTAPAGSVFVIATVELRLDQPVERPSCTTSLLGPGGRVWEPGSDAPRRKLPSYCGTDETAIRVGQPFTFENIFEVPTRYAGQLRGIVIEDPLTGKPEQVLLPPS